MFLPVGANLPFFRFPYVTVSWIVLSFAVFIFVTRFDEQNPRPAPEVSNADAMDQIKSTLTYKLAYIPAEHNQIWKFITYQFAHANLGHLISNVWYLAVFGWMLENALGSLMFLTLSLFFGALAVLPETFFQTNPFLPIVGSSGSVAFMMGAAVALFPKSKIKLMFMFFPLPNFPNSFFLPLRYLIYFWLAMQLSGMAMSLWLEPRPVAYATHLFGFSLGILVGIAFRQRRKNEKLLDVELAGRDLKAFYRGLEAYQEKKMDEANDLIASLSSRKPSVLSLNMQLFKLALSQGQQQLSVKILQNILPSMIAFNRRGELKWMLEEFLHQFENLPDLQMQERVKVVKFLKPSLDPEGELATSFVNFLPLRPAKAVSE